MKRIDSLEVQSGEFTISHDRSRMQIDTILALLRRSSWAGSRTRETVVKSVENSLCYGTFHGKRQVGFARVVTDYCTFAYLADVYVDEEYRGRGLSKRMMEQIMAHPDLKNLRRFVLATFDAHSLYAQYGFEPLSAEEREMFMQIKKDGI